MPFKMHADARRRLLDALAEVIPLLEVRKGIFLERGQAYALLHFTEKILPSKGALRDQLVSYIDELPITEFVTDTLSYELQSGEYKNEGPNQKLTQIAGFEDPASVAQRIVEGLESLPRQYKLTVKLPAELSPIMPPDQSRLEMTPEISLVRGGSDLDNLCPIGTTGEGVSKGALSGLLGGIGSLSLFDEPSGWEKDAIYLQIEEAGFIGIYGGSLPHVDALRKLRAFCGLGLALRLFDVDTRYSLATPNQSVIVHQAGADGKWSLATTLNLGEDLSRALSTIRLADFIAESGAKQNSVLAIIWAEMKSAFNGGKKADSILLAAQWFFNGSHGPDELLRYVQAMVVLEILLGDKRASDQMGLNELLRNRCAYLIGNSQEDRASVHELFGKIYDVRSQIVHRGKHRLTLEERQLSSQLRWLCRRVIQKEVDLLKADKKSESAS